MNDYYDYEMEQEFEQSQRTLEETEQSALAFLAQQNGIQW